MLQLHERHGSDHDDIVELGIILSRLRDRQKYRAAATATGQAQISFVDATDHYRMRRWRDAVFGDPGLFGEPAWDMLLALKIAEQTGRAESISSICIASANAQTTALRWIAALQSRGLVERREDLVDRRRAYLTLSPRASALMDEALSGRRRLP